MLADSGRFSSVLQHFLAQLQCSGFREGVAAMDSKKRKPDTALAAILKATNDDLSCNR